MKFRFLKQMGLVATVLFLAATVHAASYSLNLTANRPYLIANQLNTGTNGLQQVLPNVPDGSTFQKYNNGSQTFEVQHTFVAGSGWSPGGILFKPGEGAFFQSPVATTLTFTGSTVNPLLPLSLKPGSSLVARQTNGVGNFSNIVGVAALDGDRLFKWNGTGYDLYIYDALLSGWTFNGNPVSEPTAAVGEAVFVNLARGIGPLVIATQPQSSTNCPGAIVGLTVDVTGQTPITFQWRSNNVAIPGANTATLTVSNRPPGSATPYSVTASNASGVVTSLTATVTIRTATTATALTSLTRCAGSSATFTTTNFGTGPFSYQWTRNGSPIAGATTNSYTINPVVAGDAGTYCVIVTGACNSVTNCATLTVNAPTSASGPVPLTPCLGSSVTLTSTPSGTGPFSFQWTKNGQPISGATNSTHTINPVTAGDSATYCAIVTGLCNSVTNCATLTAVAAPVISASPTNQVVTGCSTSATFTVVASGGGTLTYQWFENNTAIPGATGPSYTKTPVTTADNGKIYRVTVGNACGSVNSGNATLTANLDSTPPFLVSVMPICGSNKLVLTMSESVAQGSAQQPSHYFINAGPEGLPVVQAILGTNGKTICLFTEPGVVFQGTTIYTLHVDGLTDLCGNPVSPNTQTNFTCDTTPCLTILCPTNMVVDCLGPNGTSVSYNVAVSNRCGIPFQLTCIPSQTALLPLGMTTVTCVATNDQRVSATCNFVVTVRDLTPPSITCSTNIFVVASNRFGTAVSFAPTVSDNCDPSVIVNCFPQSGSVFPIGQTTVDCVATDHSGNSRACTFTVTVEPTGIPPCNGSSKGPDFWLTIPGNFNPDPVNPVIVSLCIVGSPGTTGSVELADMSFRTNFVITASMKTRVPLPRAAELANAVDVVQTNGVHVVASADVGVVVFHEQRYTQDAFLALPTDTLGVDYMVLAYGNVWNDSPAMSGSQFAIVASRNATTVQITPSTAVGPHPAGVTYAVTLDAGQTYQLRSTNIGIRDLTGSTVVSDKPVAVFGGHQCATIPRSDLFFCNYVNEPMLPTTVWGTNFFTVPLATRSNDTWRCLAKANATEVRTNGVLAAMLNRGQFIDFPLNRASRIGATKPVQVAQFANSADYDNRVIADPTMIVVPSTDRLLTNYMVCVTTNFPASFVNVAALTGAQLRLDGVLLTLTPAAFGGFSFAQVPVTASAQMLTGTTPFLATVYGFGEYDAFGYFAGIGLPDTSPPILICPTNITVEVGTNCIGAIPQIQVTALDNCTSKSALMPVQSPPAGTQVGVGIYFVTNTVSDGQGNTVSCITTVIVRDSRLLQIVNAVGIVTNCVNSFGRPVSYAVFASGPCGATIDCLPPSGSTFGNGVTTVNCTAHDLSGHTTNATFTVTVNDTGLPQIFCPTNLTVSAGCSNCAAVTFAVTAIDTCSSNVLVVCTPASGSCIPLGTNLVRCDATDNSGNKGNCSFNIVVTRDCCTPASQGLISWWKAEHNASDSVDGNHGTASGGVTYAIGAVGEAFSFNGADSSVSVPDATNLDITGPLTIEGWIRLGALNPNVNKMVLWKGSTAAALPTSPYALFVRPDNRLSGSIAANGASANVAIGTTSLAASTWYHVALVADGAQLRLYLNGILDGTLGQTLAPYNSSFPIRIGGASTSANIFNGLIDELSLYNRALASNEIAAIYVAGGAGKCPASCGPLAMTLGPIAGSLIISWPTGGVLEASNDLLTWTVAWAGPSPYAINPPLQAYKFYRLRCQ